MIVELIAQTTEPVTHSFIGQLVVGLMVLSGLGGGVLLGRRLKVSARVEEQLLPRREFDGFKAEVKQALGKLEVRVEASLLRVFDKMDERDKAQGARIEALVKELKGSIEKTGTDAYQGRQRIWDEVKEQGKDVAAVVASSGTPHRTRRKPGS